MAVIQGKVCWASVMADRPNTNFTPKWEINVYLDSKNKKILKDLGVEDKIKTDDQGEYVKIYRPVETSTGKQRRPPVVIDKNGQPVTEDIGNGSLCAVQFRVDEWEFNKKTGVRLDLQGVMVLDHIVYNGKDGSELMELIEDNEPF